MLNKIEPAYRRSRTIYSRSDLLNRSASDWLANSRRQAAINSAASATSSSAQAPTASSAERGGSSNEPSWENETVTELSLPLRRTGRGIQRIHSTDGGTYVRRGVKQLRLEHEDGNIRERLLMRRQQQRNEIYALNEMMARLELNHFNSYRTTNGLV